MKIKLFTIILLILTFSCGNAETKLDEDNIAQSNLPTSISIHHENYFVSFGNGTIMKIDNIGNILWLKNFNDLLRTPLKLFSDNIIAIFN